VARVYIVDEAQYLCNPKAKRSKTFAGYCKKYKPQRLLLMSGTPLKNRIPDFFHLLKLLDYVNDCGFREAFPTWSSFANHFTHTHLIRRGGFLVTEYTGLKNEDELKEWLRPQYIACKLKDTDLPPLRHITISLGEASASLEKSLRKEWASFQSGKKEEMWKEDEKVVGEEHFSSAKARNALEKSDKTIAFVKDLRSSVEGPILIFTDHVAAANHMAEMLEDTETVGVIHGGVSGKKRDAIVAGFQEGKYGVLIATLGTMAVGWTLTAANVCVINDKSWLVSVNRQAEKRIHRIGQTRPCIIYTMVREGMDEIIDATLSAKEAVEQRVLGGLDENES
jgi:SNF2 family DNA or RNA helicase